MQIISEADGSLQALAPQPFESEAELQDIMERFPGLVLSPLPDDDRPDIWTIGREVGVHSGSIDLLLVDSTGHVWVVETKLSKNPEVRKQVAGQVLSYCADVTQWSAEDLEDAADAYLQSRNLGSLRDLLASNGHEADDILEQVGVRLARGDLVAIVVVDELNSVLRRLVEFVNDHADFEFLAMKVEVVHHAGERLFFPTAVGLTERSSKPGGRKPDYRSLMETADPVVVDLAARLEQLADERGWGFKIKKRIADCYIPDGWSVFWFGPAYRSVQFFVSSFRNHGFEAEAQHLLELLAAVDGGSVTRNYPTISAHHVVERWDEFVAAADYCASLCEKVRDSSV